MGVDSLFQMLH